MMVRDETQALGFGNMAMNPILVQILGAMGQPKFSRKSDDWQQFAKDWQEYIRVLATLAPGGEVPDVILLQALKGCLDEATKNELQKLLERDPS